MIFYIKYFIIKTYSKKVFDWLIIQKNYEFKSTNECISFQKKYLRELLLHAVNTVPYYKKIAKENYIDINNNNIYQEINKFPILTKSILKQEFEHLKSNNFKDKYYKNTSGGSTGEPAIFLQEYSYKKKCTATKYLFNSWVNWKFGDKMIKFWGSERDFLVGSVGIKAKLSNFFYGKILLNSFRMSDVDMKSYVSIINDNKPVLIETYVQSIYELARYIEREGLDICSPPSGGIITSAGTLTPSMKVVIERVFQCPVLNRYGSREVGDMACSCPNDEGLHINVFNHYIEILDDNLEPTKPGEVGNVYVTSLHNKIMPLIRYKIEDLAIPATNTQCSCGRGLPLIKAVIGRTGTLIKTPKGTFDSTALTTMFYHKSEYEHFTSFSKYQLIQKSIYDIDILVVITLPTVWIQEKEILKKKINTILGNDINLVICEVEDIPLSKSGKYMYIKSEIHEQ